MRNPLLPAAFTAPPPDHPVVFGEIGGRRCRLLLPIGALGDLERKTGRGVQEIVQRLALSMSSSVEIAETMALALEGGSQCTPAEAAAVTEVYIRPRLFEFVKLATEVLLAALSGAQQADDGTSAAESEADAGEMQGRGESPEISGPFTA